VGGSWRGMVRCYQTVANSLPRMSPHPALPPQSRGQGKTSGLCALAAVTLLLLSSYRAAAHDPPEEYFDRNITVALEAACVRVHYRLELSQFSLFRMPDRDKQVDTSAVKDRASLEAACLARFKVLLPDNLLVFLNGKPLSWAVERSRIDPVDSTHFHLYLRADWKPTPGENVCEIVDGNFENAPGPYRIKVDFPKDLDLLPDKLPAEWAGKGVDPNKEHRALIPFRAPETALKQAVVEQLPAEPAPPAAPRPGFWQRVGAALDSSDLTGVLSSDLGLAMLMLLALIHGAGHSLMPGHGKTAVAAYLVGDRGTPWHAVLLGIVTTLTHTSAAIGIALLLRYGVSDTGSLDRLLKFLGGLSMLLVGLWLFLQRLAGRSDHVHLFDMGHGHAHGDAPSVSANPAGTVRLILLGVAGGIIPCWGAITWVIFCVSTGQFWQALPIVLAFSAGLASVLVCLGLSVVYAGRVGESRWGSRPWFRRAVRVMPVIGAALVMLIGSIMCAASGMGSP
jgi:nickel/cobalt transporter (NicO) family protein